MIGAHASTLHRTDNLQCIRTSWSLSQELRELLLKKKKQRQRCCARGCAGEERDCDERTGTAMKQTDPWIGAHACGALHIPICQLPPATLMWHDTRVRVYGWPAADEGGERTGDFTKPVVLRGPRIAFGLTFTTRRACAARHFHNGARSAPPRSRNLKGLKLFMCVRTAVTLVWRR